MKLIESSSIKLLVKKKVISIWSPWLINLEFHLARKFSLPQHKTQIDNSVFGIVKTEYTTVSAMC